MSGLRQKCQFQQSNDVKSNSLHHLRQSISQTQIINFFDQFFNSNNHNKLKSSQNESNQSAFQQINQKNQVNSQSNVNDNIDNKKYLGFQKNNLNKQQNQRKNQNMKIMSIRQYFERKHYNQVEITKQQKKLYQQQQQQRKAQKSSQFYSQNRIAPESIISNNVQNTTLLSKSLQYINQMTMKYSNNHNNITDNDKVVSIILQEKKQKPIIQHDNQHDNQQQHELKFDQETELTLQTEHSPLHNELSSEKNLNEYFIKRHLSESKILIQEQKRTKARNSQLITLTMKSQNCINNFKSQNTAQQSSISIMDFNIIRLIGKGAYGKIYLTTHKQTGMIFATKIIPKRVILKQHNLHQLIQQCKIQMFCSHPNITKLYTVFDDSTKLYLLMEYCHNGNLYEFMGKSRHDQNQIKNSQIKKIIRQIADGVSYLHQNDIIHRDIKLQNIMLSFGRVKICDFGCSTYTKNQLTDKFVGTPLFSAPEQLKSQHYTKKVDVWSMGLILYELTIGKPLYDLDQDQSIELLEQIGNIKFPSNLNNDIKDLLEHLLKQNPQQRVESGRILFHKFFN